MLQAGRWRSFRQRTERLEQPWRENLAQHNRRHLLSADRRAAAKAAAAAAAATAGQR